VNRPGRAHHAEVVDVRRSLTGAALVLCLAAAPGCIGDDPTNPSPSPGPATPSVSITDGTAALSVEDVADHVRETLAAYEGIVTGTTVLVRVGDRTQVVVSGSADLAADRATRAGDRFAIQSITKPMVAAAVLSLVADGRLALDDTVQDVLPDLLSQGPRITVEDLLSHRSGLYDAQDPDLPPLDAWTPTTLVEVALAHPLDFRPGTSGAYSNTGYEVLGLILEGVTGRPLDEVLQTLVFDPAAMSDTTLGGAYPVQGYAGSRPLDDPYLPIVRASGGVVSTVTDVDRFFTALWGGELFDRSLVAAMIEPRGIVGPWGMDYGLGVWHHRAGCGNAIGHKGQGPGFSTRAFTHTEADRSVVVMVNDGDGDQVADVFVTAALCAE
jgi:D-alanyl-D-alanine carboxypeptidase